MNPILQPDFQVLSPDTISRVLGEAIDLLHSTGVKVGSPEALEMLHSSGASVDMDGGTVSIPEELILRCLESVPRNFSLFDMLGEKSVEYSGDKVHFNPGSSGVNILDSDSLQHRPSLSADLVSIIKLNRKSPGI